MRVRVLKNAPDQTVPPPPACVADKGTRAALFTRIQSTTTDPRDHVFIIIFSRVLRNGPRR